MGIENQSYIPKEVTDKQTGSHISRIVQGSIVVPQGEKGIVSGQPHDESWKATSEKPGQEQRNEVQPPDAIDKATTWVKHRLNTRKIDTEDIVGALAGGHEVITPAGMKGTVRAFIDDKTVEVSTTFEKPHDVSSGHGMSVAPDHPAARKILKKAQEQGEFDPNLQKAARVVREFGPHALAQDFIYSEPDLATQLEAKGIKPEDVDEIEIFNMKGRVPRDEARRLRSRERIIPDYDDGPSNGYGARGGGSRRNGRNYGGGGSGSGSQDAIGGMKGINRSSRGEIR